MIAIRVPTALWLIIVCAVISAVLQLDMPRFIYQRDVMWSEPWRWWTAQWVHVGWRHYALNILAVLCLPFIFPQVSRSGLLWAILILSPVVSVSLYWFFPDVYAYAGFSGVLHSLYVWAALESLVLHTQQKTVKQKLAKQQIIQQIIRLTTEQKFAALLLLAVVLKVLIEKKVGHTDTERLIQAPVLIEAHQIGVVAGFIYTSLKYALLKFYHSSHNMQQRVNKR